MLTRISHLQNIGPFEEVICSNTDLVFKHLNLVFGHNGSGKTMFSNVLRLLADDTDSADLLENLKADSASPASVEAIWAGKKLKIPGAQQKLRVFNATFVTEHVYDGTTSRVKRFKDGIVTAEQLKNPQIKKLEDGLLSIEKDREAVDSDLKVLVTTADTVGKALSTKWNKAIADHRLPTGLSLSGKVPKSAVIDSPEVLDEKLNEHFGAYRVSKQLTDRAADTATLATTEEVSFDFSHDVSAILKKKVAETALRALRDRLEKYKDAPLTHTSVQQWFEDGLALLSSEAETKKCPLCDSDLPNIETLIGQYAELFNDEFNALRKSLTDLETSLSTLASSSDQADSDRNNMYRLATKYKLTDKLGQDKLSTLDDFSTTALREDTKRLRTLVERKAADLDAAFSSEDLEFAEDFPKRVENLASGWKIVNGVRQKLHQILTEATFNLADAKTAAERLFWRNFDVSAANHSSTCKSGSVPTGAKTSGIALYWHLKSRLDSLVNDAKRLQSERNVLLTQLRGESRYVNHFLPRLGVTNCQIRVGDRDNEDIEIVYTNGTQKKGISYSLSEGEKTALAFAFFLSKVQHEICNNEHDDLAEYVIVIDDPVSSLDENRLSATAMLIRNMFVEKAKQVFVLSHNLIFLKHFSGSLSNAANRDREDFYLERGQLAQLPQPLSNFQTSYFYKVSKVRAFVDGGLSYDGGKDFLPNYVRMVLETFLAFKLCRLKNDSGTNQKYKSAGLGSLIDSVKGLNLKGYDAVGYITDLNALTCTLEGIQRQTDPESHGSTQDLTDFEYLSETDLKVCCQNALDVIAFLDRIHFDKTVPAQATETATKAGSTSGAPTTDEAKG